MRSADVVGFPIILLLLFTESRTKTRRTIILNKLPLLLQQYSVQLLTSKTGHSVEIY